MEPVAPQAGADAGDRVIDEDRGLPVADGDVVRHGADGWDRPTQWVTIERLGQPEQAPAFGPRHHSGVYSSPDVAEEGSVGRQRLGEDLGKASARIERPRAVR